MPHLFVMDAFQTQNLIVEARLKIVNALFKLSFKIGLALEILPL